MYLPSLPFIAADLGASEQQIQLTIGLFLAGFSLGMLFYVLLSDRFGRRCLLMAGIVLYLFATLGCALASEPGQLIAKRLVQALGGAAASVLARVIGRDLFALNDAARVLPLMQQVTLIVTLVAAVQGGCCCSAAGACCLWYCWWLSGRACCW
ncbi:MFS transporter [Pseudomonas frederiksbergensis]|uniref:MFS transporter n=1 Tax=Pseudomonas frederiksbergensis TaxID=104087 RepID=UPI001F025D16|nr:MFS transporter [Pseudomonas frederiksbergensis]